ncbi:MAG: hypothetical protein CMC08_10385 [Flavobacteriaceae bacterium]|nr:hypothetical protein [Flavobacteriaceae bacterium]
MKKQLQKEIQQLAQQLGSENRAFDTQAIIRTVVKLHERLVVLRHLENQLLGETVENGAESFDSKSFREQNWFSEPEPVPQPDHKEDLVEPLMEKIKDLVAQMPEESQRIGELLEEVLPKKNITKNDLEEFASNYQQTPTFERKESAPAKPSQPQSTTPRVAELANDEKPKSLNDAVNKGLNIGLNDRLAFIKHLFDGNAEDYTRVLSQINTKNSLSEAESFIKGKVKPDYNYWLNKDEYVDRFMSAIEKRFN